MPSPWARPLAVATPTRRPVKSPGPTSTATASTVGEGDAGLLEHVGDAPGPGASACRRRPVAQTPARGPPSSATATPTSSVAVSMPSEDHRRPAAHAVDPGAPATSSRRSAHAGPRPAIVTVRRRRRRRRRRRPGARASTVERGSSPEDRRGRRRPTRPGHRPVLRPARAAPRSSHLGQVTRAGRGRRGPAGAARPRPAHGYWRTRVKVGLVTGPATPRPRAKPWANVVLPAPSPPTSSTTSPARPSAGQARRPSRSVAAAPGHSAATPPTTRAGPAPGAGRAHAGARAASSRLARTRSARISATTSPPERSAAAGW